MRFKETLLHGAEIIDAWRIVPRTILIAYMYLMMKTYIWYVSLITYVEKQCDAGLMKFFTDNGMTIDDAMNISCRIVDVVGGPTTAQTAFVATIFGLSGPIFGFYTSTGRKWGRNKNNIDSKPTQPIVVNYPPTNHPPTTVTEIDPIKFEP